MPGGCSAHVAAHVARHCSWAPLLSTAGNIAVQTLQVTMTPTMSTITATVGGEPEAIKLIEAPQRCMASVTPDPIRTASTMIVAAEQQQRHRHRRTASYSASLSQTSINPLAWFNRFLGNPDEWGAALRNEWQACAPTVGHRDGQRVNAARGLSLEDHPW